VPAKSHENGSEVDNNPEWLGVARLSNQCEKLKPNASRELHLYSLADGSDTVVAFPNLKAPDSVYNFSWLPDSRRIARRDA
jgi:hypothetical protein